jgi:hypothetical protein
MAPPSIDDPPRDYSTGGIGDWELSEELCTAAQRGYLALFIDFYFETPLRRDLDGGLKLQMK